MKTLRDEYIALLLREARGEITREERLSRLLVLQNDHPEAVGLSKKQLQSIVDDAVHTGMEILDEVNASQGGRWQ